MVAVQLSAKFDVGNQEGADVGVVMLARAPEAVSLGVPTMVYIVSQAALR